MITIEEIQHLATLARINVSEEECEKLRADVASILQYIDQIQEVSAKADTTIQIGEVHTVMRDDDAEHESGVYTDTLLAVAPDSKDGYVKVKNIL